MKNIICIWLFSILLTGFGHAQNSFNLVENFNYSGNSFLAGIDTVTENLGQYGVLAKTFVLSPAISSINVQLEPGLPIVFSKEESFSNVHGQTEWIGLSNSLNCVSCKLHLVDNNNIIEGSLFKTTQTFGISYIGESNYLFYERSNNNADCDTHLFPAVSYEETSPTSARVASGSCATANTVSMIIAYTPEFASTFSASDRQNRINDFLNTVVESVNESYIESDLNVRVRLAFSYQTPDSEFGNKDDDFGHFVLNGFGTRYDEIYDYIDDFNAEVSILLVAANVGGRADRGRNMGMYGKNGAGWNYGVAHEIGHMLDLEHNREQFDWFERIFLDGKRAYGYRNSSYRTVMSYGNDRTRVPLYSDYRYKFPDGNIAGDNNRAKARNYAAGHLGRILNSGDPASFTVNQTLLGTQTATYVATSDITTQNLIANSESRVQIEAPNMVTLEPGTHLQSGATALIRIAGNSTDLATLFNEGISITPKTSPSCSNNCVVLEIDGYRDDFTFEWFQEDDRIGCGNCQSTTELGSGREMPVCFANAEGDPDEQRTFRVVVTDLSRCTLGEIYLDGKLYCGTNFREGESESLSSENENIPTFSVYPNPARDKKFKLMINSDNFDEYNISIRNLSGKSVYTATIDDANSFPFVINMSDEPSGIYIIDYCSNTNECFSHKIMLE